MNAPAYVTHRRYHWKWARRYSIASVACNFAGGWVLPYQQYWRAIVALLAGLLFMRLAIRHRRAADAVLPW